MKNILLVNTNNKALEPLENTFRDRDYQIDFADSGEAARIAVRKTPYCLVISDETLADTTGIQLAEDITKINAMIHCALISSLTDQNFHEATEGLGILKKLSPTPTAGEARVLEDYLSGMLHPCAVKTQTENRREQ